MKTTNCLKRILIMDIGHKVLSVCFLVLLCLSVKAQNLNYALQDVGTWEPFHEGLAVIYKNGLWGAINTSGNIAIQPQFKSLSDFSNGTAIAETKTGHGIVNRNGTFILEPKYEIRRNEEKYPDVYMIIDKESNRQGIFYNGRIVLPVIYEFLMYYHFPFVHYKLNGEHETINVQTGEIFEAATEQSKIIICYKDGYHFFTKNGEPIAKTKHKRSSKGLLLFQDDMTKKYGIKDSNGKILIEAKYNVNYDIWLDDRVILYNKEGEVVVNNQGKIILTNNKGNSYSSEGKYIWEEDDDKKELILYNSSGKKLSKFQGERVYDTGHSEWFEIDMGNDKKIAYDARHNKQYKDVKYVTYEEGAIRIHKEDGTYYYYNADTGKEIAGPLEYARGVHEGLAVVQRVGAQYNEVIDINGRVIMRSSKDLKIRGNYFSEGVISVEENNIDNYIYNPLGHKDYVYNQTSYSDRTVAQWNKLGHEAFKKKQFATAKDYYYRVMMNDPTDVDAVINYGAALGNMGYYDEAIESCRIALDIDPDNQLAKDNLRINLDNKRIDEEKQQREKEKGREERSTKSSTFWDALGNFANILSSIAGGENVYQPYSSFSMDADYSPSYSNSGGSSHNYQAEYNKWANLAERHYNSLTNLGYRVKRNDGSRSGGTLGMSTELCQR